MDASERGALMLVRFVALALIGFSLAELTLPFILAVGGKAPLEILPCLLRALPALAGVAILIKARAIAGWLDDLLDN